VLVVGAVILAAVGGFAARLHYDHNLLNLQARGLDSVAWEHKLIAASAGATWDALGVAATRDEALALKDRFAATPGVGRVVEVASLIPADQDAKLPVVRAIHDRLAYLPPVGAVPVPGGSSPSAVHALATRVGQFGWADRTVSAAMLDLRGALDAAPKAVAAARLKEFDRRLVADLASDLRKLHAVSRPDPIALADLPADLRERYVGTGGEFLVRAFAKDSLWEFDALERFTTAAAATDPEATGKAFRTLEGLRAMKSGFERAGLYALAVIVAVLLLDFRSPKHLLLALFPLAVGVLLTAGVMGLCGVNLNPANLIALPLIVGVGVDNGVHVLHDYRGRAAGKVYRLGAATGRGVLVAALTTVLGFGTLMTARHEGMKSLGLALTLGVTFSMTAALVLLPAVLRLIDERALKARPTVAVVLRFRRAA
jgi:hypothetical protein